MSIENIFSHATEDNLIEGISDLSTDITQCFSKMTADLKYTLLYNDYSLVVINNITKELISKNIFTKKIHKIKVYKNNMIAYVLIDNEGSTLVTTHIEFIENDLQLKKPFFIVDFIIFDFLTPFEYYLYLNTRGEIHICRNGELLSSKNNIFEDLRNYGLNLTIDDVHSLEYCQSNNNLFLFFRHGLFYNYYLNFDLLNSNNSEKCQLLFNGKAYNFNSDGYKDTNITDIVSVKSFTVQLYDKKLDHVIIGYNQLNKIKMKFSIFLVEKSPLYENFYDFFFQNIEYDFEGLKIEMNNRIGFPLVEMNLFNSKLPFDKDVNGSSGDKIVFMIQTDKITQYNFYIADISDLLQSNGKYVIEFFASYIDGIGNVKDIKFLGAYDEEYENFEQVDREEKKGIKNYNLSIRVLSFINKNQVYLFDEILNMETKLNFFKENICEKEDYRKLINQDVFLYFENYQRFVLNDKEKMAKLEDIFSEYIKEILIYEYHSKENFNFDELVYNSDIKRGKSQEKFDLYLAYLILSNNFLSIKNYMLILDDKREDYPYVSNEKLFYTIKCLFRFLSINLLENLRDNNFNTEFFRNERLLAVFDILNKLLYVNKARAEVPIFKTFRGEEEIIMENTVEISYLIEQVESVILIVKMFRNFSLIYHEYEWMHDYEFPKFEYLITFLGLLFKIEKNSRYFPEIKLFYINHLEFILSSNIPIDINYNIHIKALNIKLHNSIYLTKFILFLVYAYFAIVAISINDEELLEDKLIRINLKKFFTKENPCEYLKQRMHSKFLNDLYEEVEKYFDLVFAIFLMDNFINPSLGSILKINTKLVGEFMLFINKEPYDFSRIILPRRIFNSQILDLLLSHKRHSDALLISKNLISYFESYEELVSQLNIFLNTNLLNLAFQFVNNCFACRVEVNENFFPNEFSSELVEKTFYNSLKQNSNFTMIAHLYYEFFRYLINNKKLEFLFSIPLNMIERHLLKELILSDKNLEYLLVLYYIKMKNVKGAKNALYQLENCDVDHCFLGGMIHLMEFIFGRYESCANNVKKIEIDEEFFNRLKKEFKVKINRNENYVLLKERNYENLEYEGFNYDNRYLKMNTEKSNFGVSFDRNALDAENFRKSNDQIEFVSELENLPHNPSNLTLNETLKNILDKKQETAKKTFNLYSEKKSGYYDDFNQQNFKRPQDQRLFTNEKYNQNNIFDKTINEELKFGTPIKINFDTYKSNQNN